MNIISEQLQIFRKQRLKNWCRRQLITFAIILPITFLWPSLQWVAVVAAVLGLLSLAFSLVILKTVQKTLGDFETKAGALVQPQSPPHRRPPGFENDDDVIDV